MARYRLRRKLDIGKDENLGRLNITTTLGENANGDYEALFSYGARSFSIWNAAAAGETAEAILAFLDRMSRYPVPPNVRREIQENIQRFGLLRLERLDGVLRLTSSDDKLLGTIGKTSLLKGFFEKDQDDGPGLAVVEHMRGDVKQAAFTARGVVGPHRVVIKSFSLSHGSTMPQIVRESRALEAARALGLAGLDVIPAAKREFVHYAAGQAALSERRHD